MSEMNPAMKLIWAFECCTCLKGKRLQDITEAMRSSLPVSQATASWHWARY